VLKSYKLQGLVRHCRATRNCREHRPRDQRSSCEAIARCIQWRRDYLLSMLCPSRSDESL